MKNFKAILLVIILFGLISFPYFAHQNVQSTKVLTFAQKGDIPNSYVLFDYLSKSTCGCSK